MRRMCITRANPAGASRQLAKPNTGNTYSLDAQGCVLAQESEVSWLSTQGFTFGDPLGKGLTLNTGVAAGTASFAIGVLPKGGYVEHNIVKNLTANAVNGGIAIGSSPGAADVVASQPSPPMRSLMSRTQII